MTTDEQHNMPYMKSMAACLNRLVAEGYTEDFKVGERGMESLQRGVIYQPAQVEVVNFFRFEGESDPDDNAIVYVIETDDRALGTLIDGYGVYNDPRIAQFMQEVQNIRKKVVKE